MEYDKPLTPRLIAGRITEIMFEGKRYDGIGGWVVIRAPSNHRDVTAIPMAKGKPLQCPYSQYRFWSFESRGLPNLIGSSLSCLSLTSSGVGLRILTWNLVS
jgi:hypothetical protein